MSSQSYRSVLAVRQRRLRAIASASVVAAALGFAAAGAAAQTYGVATMPPGTLNHTTGSAIAKVLKEKGGLNVLVQPTAGESSLIPMVGRAEAELGIANIAAVTGVTRGTGPGQEPELRLVGSLHALRAAFFVRNDSDLKAIADLKGKRVTTGYSAMRTVDTIVQAMLASAGLAIGDVTPVPVPNVNRGADDFMSGNADTFMFGFGAPKVREVDASVRGIRALEISEAGIAASRKVFPYGYLSEVSPGPVYVGVAQKMKVYSYDNMLFTNAKVKDDLVYKIVETMDKNGADLAAVQPVLRGFSAADLYKQYAIPYHPGALKYFKDKGLQPKAVE